MSSHYNHLQEFFPILLEPNGVELPSELLQSQHLHFQRKRKCSQSDDTNEKKEKQQKIDHRNKSVMVLCYYYYECYRDSLSNLLQITSSLGHGKENINN